MDIISKINNICRQFGFEIKKFKRNEYNWLSGLNINSIIDVGANVGQFAIEINKVLPNAKIYSFEPLTDAYNELVRNTQNLKITTFNYALGNENTKKDINVSSHSPSSSFLEMSEIHKELYKYSRGQSVETVKIKRLDDIINGLNIASEVLLKIDVQGFELDVLKGALNSLNEILVIIIEVNYKKLYKEQTSFKEIFYLLDKYFFEFSGNLQQSINPKSGEIVYSNSLFLKKLNLK